MVKYTISALLVLASVGSAYALSPEELTQPGSAVTWYQDDADMKRLDVADYLFQHHSKKDVSEAKINQVNQCVDKEMKSKYSTAKETDKNAPSMLSLLKKCNG